MIELYLIKKDHKQKKIATNSGDGKIGFNNSGISSVDDFNRLIANYVFSDEDYCDTSIFPPHIIKSEDITGFIIHRMMWRRCIGYLVIQKSSKQVRYLCYLSTRAVHNALSFGTSHENVSVPSITDNYMKYVKEMIKKLDEYKEIIKIVDMISASDVKSKFGI